MANPPTDARWPKLLSLTVHEFRTPLTVVAGYIRMLLKDRAGPLTEPQRRLLEEAEKSCSRLSGLLAEISELSALEGATATFNRAPLDLRAVLEDVVSGLPALPDRAITIELDAPEGPLRTTGDATRLRSALSSVVGALRREIVGGGRLVVHAHTTDGDRRLAILIGEPERLDQLRSVTGGGTMFDEWRGGVGLSLANARRVIEAHGGNIRSPADGAKAAATIQLPLEG
ncbi:MAG TPA: HAMP domain-containing sensor histidine kinase [Vicinamibacterales bacterium]|nr:HAMP domain-containing sensor histidine kinase [Vicinamibacterales bacterium]